MSFATDDLGVLGNLAEALGIFEDGEPNPGWFGAPDASLKKMLSNEAQREALIAFVDEAMGGADRTTDPRGVIWLPIVNLGDPDITIAVTVDDQAADNTLHIGIGMVVRTSGDVDSSSSLAVPLFRAKKDGGPSVSNALLLGSPGGRIRLATQITIDSAPPVPGQARLGAIGIEVDLPTAPGDPADPVFGLSLTGFQLPGATSPRDIRVAADGVDELDDALLDLVLALVKSQADAAAPNSIIAAVGGLLGLKSGDAIPDFPITALPMQGVQAIAAWLHGLITNSTSRNQWLGYLATLFGVTPPAPGDPVSFNLGGGATLEINLRVDTGPTGNARLTPTLGIRLGNASARVEARADLFQVDLVTGAAKALPQFGVWAAAGTSASRVLDIPGPPVARADTLRIGFALDPERHLTFVLAADGVVLGSHTYPTLDLSSPDAVMDAVGNTVSDVAAQLLGNLGGVLPAVRLLIGLDAPAGVTAITLPALMTNPVNAISGYWQALFAAAGTAVTTVLTELRNALADAGSAASAILGTGTALDPWRVPLIGPLALEFHADGPVLSIGLAAGTSVDQLGERCTVIDTRIAATLAVIDLQAKTASLLAGVEGVLSARERGVNPPRVTLSLGNGTALTARGVGLRLGWTPAGGLSAGVSAPDLQLATGDLSVPIALPAIGADGNVTLPPAAWDGVEALVGYLGDLLGGFFGETVGALGWTTDAPSTAGLAGSTARLRLADLIADPAEALGHWLPQLALSEAGPEALVLLADLFAGSGANRGFILGTGHPDDPYRLALDDGVPNIAVWFPPAGLEPRLVAAPEALRRWRPGESGLSPLALAAGLQAEARVAADVRELVEERDVAGGLAALALRWAGGDGRIVPPASPPTGVTIDRAGFAMGQLLGQLDIEDLIGRVPTTTVYVALGAAAWVDAPAGRRVDLSTPHLDAAMFAAPAAAAGDWFIALGGRADCLAAGHATDGTPEQAARLARVLDALAGISNDVAVVALAGAGHAARLAAQAQTAVTDLVTLGAPLSAIALTALSTQPTADALRLLHRLLPSLPAADEEPEDEDLALGRALVGAMMELVDRADPTADLRAPDVPPGPPRAGLAVTAVFGAVTDSQVSRAITAIVAAGLAERARIRATTALPKPTGVQAGLRLLLAPTSTGSLSISGSALLRLFKFDQTTGIDTSRHLRVQLRVGDRVSWLCATPELELRSVSADLSIPLDGSSPGTATVTLHDARVFGQSWERLVLGTGPGAVPLLPEARVLLAAAVQRISADAAGVVSLALDSLLAALGITDPAGGLAGDALDQLLHDPGGLLRQRLATAGFDVSDAVTVLLGPLGGSVDLAARAVRVQGGSNGSGRFGWHADVTASPSGLGGELRFGADSALPTGNLNLVVALQPLNVSLQWHQAGGTTDTVPLWPNPDAQAIARALARSAPSLGGHAALELMRRADESVRPIIDAALDAFGLLGGVAGDAQRAIRPLAGLLADPAGYLRSAGSLGANPVRIQGLFDALRPLLGVAGAAGSPLVLGSGISFSVVAAGAGARLALDVDASGWVAPNGVAGRLAGGIGASLSVGMTGPPTLGLNLHVGLTGAAPGRQAVHARLGAGGIELFVRPAAGNDISLIPFAGLGSLAAAAEAALPFLLDQLAGVGAPVGPLVAKVGDALGLRSGAPAHFDGALLHGWADDPAGKLLLSIPGVGVAVLAEVAPLLDSFMPAGVSASAGANTLTVGIGAFELEWSPTTGVVALEGNNVVVPGIEHVSFRLALAATGIEEITVTAGPANINAGGVLLKPFVTVSAGNDDTLDRRIVIGMAVDDTHRFALRWLLDTHQVGLVAIDGVQVAGAGDDDPATVALRIVEAVCDLVASVAMAQPAVTQLLNTPVGASTVRNMLRGVVLDQNTPTQLIDGMFNPATLLTRVQKLFNNIAAASISIDLGDFIVSFTVDNNIIGLQLSVDGRFALLTGDVMLWLENDDAWIENNAAGDGGIFIGFLPTTGTIKFTPSLAVNGVGLRIGKSSGPLLDVGLSLESIALHVFARIAAGNAPGEQLSGGVQLQFSNLAVSAGGAQGDNGIAQGVMRDTGPTPPQPAFSPALAIQKHGSQPVHVTLRAGDGDGPWWIAIQKGFGPLYLEQIGFGATMPGGTVQSISLLMDGSVSMFGLTCAVDDLQITYLVSRGDFFNPANWHVDLAGLAVSANMAGLSIAGGLLKLQTPAGIEYLGMLLGRFGVYGITLYGGYGEGKVQGTNDKFTAFFAVGAVNGPIGGPPAFFLTGIGGGFGINRELIVPTDLSRFGDYPLIQALDIAAQPQDPMTQLRKLGEYFPMQKGTYWFAAGLSFNSFALVDGIAVVAVEIGDGLDINLLGLARMALPRPQVALVSIELALLVRFSSSEGVLWVQGQLTDNSWLLYPDVRLTGGFAYVIWFKGDKKGEFVLTLGGYHPDFHRDGYPVVPRLGLRWSVSDNIVIKAESYFALTSEALMAGGAFEASARFGPAWAEVKFGCNGIVYFDPFHYQVDAYARIAAGVTIDTWIFGEVTFSISIGASIEVEGPDFHGTATFEVGPIELSVSFGESDKAQKQPLSGPAFITKYLEAGDSGAAKPHALMTAGGALPAKGEDSTPDGSAARPFVVVVEFSMTFTSTVPATSITRVQPPAGMQSTSQHAASRSIGVAPMDKTNLQPGIKLTWKRGTAQTFPFVATARPFGSFPVGIWGPSQDPNNRKVPKAEMIEALNELDLVSVGEESAPGPEIPYYQVEINDRRPLPFSRRTIDVSTLKSQAQAVAGLITAPATVSAAFQEAKKFLTATPTAVASLRGERQSPPLLGTLAEGLQIDPGTAIPEIAPTRPQKVYDHFIDAPVAVGFMSGATVDLRVASPARTTVKGSVKAWRKAPPSFASIEAERSKSIAARLVLAEPQAARAGRTKTVIGAVEVPLTAVAHTAPAIVARTGAASAMLGDFTTALATGKASTRRRVAAAAKPNASLLPGQTVVLKLPNAHADAAMGGERPRLGVSGAPARVVLLGHGGNLLADQLVGPDVTGKQGSIEIAVGTERIVAIGQSTQASDAIDAGLAGWHAGRQMPYAGWASAVAPGCVVHSNGEPLKLHGERLDAGWVSGVELARGVSTVSTTFTEAPRTVVIVLDDPTAFGDPADGRQLVMGLDGAERAQDAAGNDRPPVLLAMENRSVLAYDIVADRSKPVVVTIASEAGWSLVGVMGSAQLDATGAVAAISSRGLDAVIRPFAAAPTKDVQASQLAWLGPVRTPVERHQARVLASGRPLAAGKSSKPSRRRKGAHQ